MKKRLNFGPSPIITSYYANKSIGDISSHPHFLRKFLERFNYSLNEGTWGSVRILSHKGLRLTNMRWYRLSLSLKTPPGVPDKTRSPVYMSFLYFKINSSGTSTSLPLGGGGYDYLGPTVVLEILNGSSETISYDDSQDLNWFCPDSRDGYKYHTIDDQTYLDSKQIRLQLVGGKYVDC